MSACRGRCKPGSMCPNCDPTKAILVREGDLLMAYYAIQKGDTEEALARLKAVLEERPFGLEAGVDR